MGRTLGKKLTYSMVFGITATTTLSLILSCQKAAEETLPSVAPVVASRNLYVASGFCYSGTGITSYSGANSSRMISKVDLTSGVLTPFLDLSSTYQGGDLAPETSPQSIIDNGTSLLMLTENAVNMGDRKIFSIPKSSTYNMSVLTGDALALTQTAAHITRTLVKDADSTLLFSKSIAVERIGNNTLRIPMGANPWINAPAGSCATSITLISSLVVLPPYTGTTNGKVIFAHAGNTAALNRLAIVSQDGYAIAGNCINGYQTNLQVHTYAPNVTGPAIAFVGTGSTITAMTYISTGTGTGKLITAYSASVATELNNNTNLNYAIVMWDVTESSSSAATITNPVVLYKEFSDIFAISAMTYDSVDNSLYVATASQPGVANQTTSGYGYKVEKFTLNVTTPSLTLVRVNNKPFLDRSSSTKCISSLAVGE